MKHIIVHRHCEILITETYVNQGSVHYLIKYYFVCQFFLPTQFVDIKIDNTKIFISSILRGKVLSSKVKVTHLKQAVITQKSYLSDSSSYYCGSYNLFL